MIFPFRQLQQHALSTNKKANKFRFIKVKDSKTGEKEEEKFSNQPIGL